MYIAIICGYGVYDPRLRTAKEMQGLDEYYLACLEDIKSRPEVKTIILCGGYTNSVDRAQSEAGSVFTRFIGGQNIINPEDYSWVLEDQSVNSAQNLSFSIMKVLYSLPRVEKFIVYCDKVRKIKMRVLAWRILGPLTGRPFQVVGFKRRDTHPNSTWPRQFAQAFWAAISPSYVRNLLMAEKK